MPRLGWCRVVAMLPIVAAAGRDFRWKEVVISSLLRERVRGLRLCLWAQVAVSAVHLLGGTPPEPGARLRRRAQPLNLLYCFVGVVLGTLIGVLPGIGPVATIALLLPLTFYAAADRRRSSCSPASTTARSTAAPPPSILLNVPGESASVVTCLDGYQMARKGRAGAALGIAAIGSFIAGTVGVLLLAAVAAAARARWRCLRPARVLRAHAARPHVVVLARGVAAQGARAWRGRA